MAQKYVLGVDGGNTKTDYLLCRTDGSFVDLMRASNCSHENHERGYDWMQETMQGHLDAFFAKRKITVNDIAAAAFGLAGADVPVQVKELEKRIKAMGFKKFALANDGILGVKAITEAGVCAINGTGDVVVGIDNDGKFLQVGGIGELSGDNGGGGIIARKVVTAAYKSHFRAGVATALLPGVLKILNITTPDELPAAINALGYGPNREQTRVLVQLADAEAQSGDKTAQKILDDVGLTCAEGVVGCVRNLNFRGEVVVIKAGSIWNVIGYPGMIQAFTDYVQKNCELPVRFELLESTPALGAVFWAKELLDGKVAPAYREELRRFLSLEKYEELAGGK